MLGQAQAQCWGVLGSTPPTVTRGLAPVSGRPTTHPGALVRWELYLLTDCTALVVFIFI